MRLSKLVLLILWTTVPLAACSDDTGPGTNENQNLLPDGSAYRDAGRLDSTRPEAGGTRESCNALDDDGDGVTDSEDCLVTIRRFYNRTTGDHMYKAGDENPDPGYELEEFATFRLYGDQVPGTRPVYQLSNGTDHMLSLDPQEGAEQGYQSLGVLGYAADGTAWPAAGLESTPICRYANRSTGDHMVFPETEVLATYGYEREACPVSVWDWRYDRVLAPLCQMDLMVDCTAPAQYLPVVTHWRAGRFEYLGTDPVDLYEQSPILDPNYTPGACYPSYKLGIPDYEDYLCDTYSCVSIPESDARDLLSQLCNWLKVPFQLLPPAPWNGNYPVVQDPASGACRVQIVHGSVVDGSLVTVFLPPNWVADAPEGTYPIVLNSFYDLNDNVFRQHGPALAALVAQSGLGGRRGVIGVLSNGGGGLASRGFDRRMYEVTAETIDWVARRFGGSRYEVITFGGSRGAFTSLAIASNPYGYDYRVLLAVAIAPPTMLGSHALLTSPTFPALFAVLHQDVGLADAWRAGWSYPACAGKPHLTGLSGKEALLSVLTGTSDFAEADRELSLTSDAFIQGLLDAGTQIYLEVTGHDVICPYILQVAYGVALLQAGVPLEAHVMLRNGHQPHGTVFFEKLQAAVQALTEPGWRPLGPTDPAPQFIEPSVHFWTVNRQDGSFAEIHPDTYPFTFEGPYKVAPGEQYPYVFVGENGTDFELTVERNGQVYQSVTGTITDGAYIAWQSSPPGPPGGPYEYHLRIRKPGSTGWQEIPRTNTPSGDPAVVWVLDEEPIEEGNWAAADFSAPQAPYIQAGTPNSWGLSEY